MQYKMMVWPDLGSAIQSKHKNVIERPNCDSCWPGTSVRKYAINPLDITALDSTSTERYTRDMDRYTDALAALKKDEAQFNSFIRSSFSEETHILLLSNPRYVTASNNSSSYDLYFAWNSIPAPAASALHKAQWFRSSPALGPAPSISSKTSTGKVGDT